MDDVADDGTLLHAKLEALVPLPVDTWPATIASDAELGPALAPLVIEAAEQVQDMFVFGLPVVNKGALGLGPDDHYELGHLTTKQIAFVHQTDIPASVKCMWDLVNDAKDAIYCEVGVDPGVTAPGTADLLLVQGNRAVVVDYKSNYVVRDHSLQGIAYVLGVFHALPKADYVEFRVVAPRLGDVHIPRTYTRADIPELEAQLKAIVDASADPFTPGCPGSQCVFCAGNGRCAWQAASLRDIPMEESALVLPAAWRNMLTVATPEIRGQRRALVKWLDGFCDAVKDDDKEWALANPDVELPGFTKTVGLGRASLDKDRLKEINETLSLTLGLPYETLVSFLVPNRDKLAEFVALMRGITEAEAKKTVAKALAPYEKRGAPVISFRAAKAEKPAKGKKEIAG